jgi:hypothetical protein
MTASSVGKAALRKPWAFGSLALTASAIAIAPALALVIPWLISLVW